VPDRVAVVYSVVSSLGRGVEGDLIPDEETALIAAAVAEALAEAGLRASLHPVDGPEALEQALARQESGATVIFNLCEALAGLSGTGTDPALSTAGGEIVAARIIADSGFRYTGADPGALGRCLDKALTHRLLDFAGVPTAPSQVFTKPGGRLRIPYPVIVKPAGEDCSLAISEDSVVDNDRDLTARIESVIETYHQPALVEKFLDGREFSVSVWGNAVPEIAGTGQIDFSSCEDPRKRLETFENKWSDRFPGRYPARVRPEELLRLSELGIAAYRAMGCCGYGRVDVREDSGRFYVLEVNPNPSLARDAGFARAASASGLAYGQMLRRIVELALERASVVKGATGE